MKTGFCFISRVKEGVITKERRFTGLQGTVVAGACRR